MLLLAMFVLLFIDIVDRIFSFVSMSALSPSSILKSLSDREVWCSKWSSSPSSSISDEPAN